MASLTVAARRGVKRPLLRRPQATEGQREPFAAGCRDPMLPVVAGSISDDVGRSRVEHGFEHVALIGTLRSELDLAGCPQRDSDDGPIDRSVVMPSDAGAGRVPVDQGLVDGPFCQSGEFLGVSYL